MNPSLGNAPRALWDADAAALRAVDRLYFDVDDTLTWHGTLPLAAHAALEQARALGLSLVAVTGRSAAWGELLLRFFALDAVIAETGALALVRRDRGIAVVHTEEAEAVRRENAARRRAATDKVLAAVPEARLALDNGGRAYDVAFDLVEDGPPIPVATAAHIRRLLTDEGLTVAQSSVHINAWFGRFDKATMVDRVLRAHFGTSLDEAAPTLAYVGDSENDGPMFARAGIAVGVANVAPHLAALQARGQAPRFLVGRPGGHGFADVVTALAAARA